MRFQRFTLLSPPSVWLLLSNGMFGERVNLRLRPHGVDFKSIDHTSYSFDINIEQMANEASISNAHYATNPHTLAHYIESYLNSLSSTRCVELEVMFNSGEQVCYLTMLDIVSQTLELFNRQAVPSIITIV